MKALLISDRKYLTNTCQELNDLTGKFFKQKGYEIEMIEVCQICCHFSKKGWTALQCTHRLAITALPIEILINKLLINK